MPRLIELNHIVRDGLVTYPGLPAPRIATHSSFDASRASYATGTEFEIARIEMVANTGTYIDAPAHRFRDGADVAGWPLEKLADLEGLVIDAPRERRDLRAADIGDLDVRGKAVLLRTGWSVHFGTAKYGSGHPFVSREAAQALAQRGAALVGIDSLNIDDTGDGARPAHTLLLGAAIPIVEHLTNLEQLPQRGFRFFAAPVRVAGLGSFPVRAFASVENAASTASRSDDEESEFFARIARGRTDLVLELLAAGAPAKSRDENGVSLVQWCAYHGDVTAVRRLLEHGEHLESLGPNFDLNGAVFHGHARLVEFLIERGADVHHALADTGERPLHSALCKSGRPEFDAILERLLTTGADPNVATLPGVETGAFMRDVRTKGETPLHRAAAFGSEQAIALLLAKGARVDARDMHGDTPLTWASWHLRPRSVLRLLAYGPHRV
jgi:kynurenine formamidase